MSELLEQAVEIVRQLPESGQDLAAGLLFAFAARRSPTKPLDEETRAAIREGIAQADRGELASDEDMAAFFARRGA